MRNVKISALGICALAAASVMGLGAHSGRANLITDVITGTGNQTNTPSTFSGTVTLRFDTTAGTLSITMDNTTSETYAAGDLMQGMSFNISTTGGGSLSTAAFSSVTGNLINVASDGTYSSAGAAAVTGGTNNITGTSNWVLSSTATGLTLKTSSGFTLIGDPTGGNYSAANGSIKGNGPHNPFLQNSPTFVLDLPNIVGASNVDVTWATIYYTTGGVETTTRINGGTPLPEPAALSLFSIPAIGLLLRKRRVA